jgi:hypothetical protein
MSNKSVVQNKLEQIEKNQIAANSVSEQIAKLIPHLKRRQFIARKLGTVGSSKIKDELHRWIERCNEEIKTILGIY